jgi:hypothetical protein
MAGASAQQIASNSTSLLAMQRKKCPSFDDMQVLFGTSPSCKPVDPMELGGMESEHDGDGDTIEDEGDDSQGQDLDVAAPAPPAPEAPKPAAVAAAAPLASATGKPAATFHLAPSKNKVLSALLTHVTSTLLTSPPHRKKKWISVRPTSRRSRSRSKQLLLQPTPRLALIW